MPLDKTGQNFLFVPCPIWDKTGQKPYMSCLSQTGQNGTLCNLSCPVSEIILILGQTNRGQDTETKWDKTSYLSQMSHVVKSEKFRVLGQTNRGQTSYLSRDRHWRTLSRVLGGVCPRVSRVGTDNVA